MTQQQKKSKDESAKSSTTRSPDSSISWLNKLIIATLSEKCSRNNTPSRAHQLTKILNRNSYGDKQLILIVCEQANAIAYVPAISRAYPLFSHKTTKNDPAKSRCVQVLFVYTDDSSELKYPSSQEIECFSVLSRSVRLTARIIDTPCAEMTTDHFLEVSI